jgi:hypothetical protein
VHAKSDPDLAVLHDSESFKALTQIRIGYEVNWNALMPDILILSNRSDFDWTNVIIRVNYLESAPKSLVGPALQNQSNSQNWQTITGEAGIERERLNKGESLSIKAFDSIKNILNSVQLMLKTDQGSVSVIFRNDAGYLSVSHSENLID